VDSFKINHETRERTRKGTKQQFLFQLHNFYRFRLNKSAFGSILAKSFPFISFGGVLIFNFFVRRTGMEYAHLAASCRKIAVVFGLHLVLFALTATVGFAQKIDQRSLKEGDTDGHKFETSIADGDLNALIFRDLFGVPQVFALNERDVYFALGYLHAKDRFFQMDVSRRQASGTLAEMFGAGPGDAVLRGDIQLRTFGLRRAAARSLEAYPADTRAILEAYSAGVNNWLDNNALPPEYTGLEITNNAVPRWTPLDSLTVAKLLAFGLSFETADLTTTQLLFTYQAAGQAGGFNGTNLFFQDVVRSAPFDNRVSIPPGQNLTDEQESDFSAETSDAVEFAPSYIEPHTVTAIQGFLQDAAVNPLLNKRRNETGSNWWVISGAKSETGFPLLANDPHLSLSSPAVFYEARLSAVNLQNLPNSLNVYGVTFPGVPGVVQGFNDRIQWGSTVNPMDVTDFYQEQVVVNNAGIPVATRFRGATEPLTIIPEVFRANQPLNGTANDVVVIAPGNRPSGAVVPPATFVVPRRNNGALITAPSGPNPQQLTAVSVQYTGFSATRELDTFLGFSRARNLADFRQALQFFDFGSQNWGYSDIDGNIAYYTSGENPLREDLQANTVDGLPPYFIRDGSGALRHEWIPRSNVPATQALRYEILPFNEMPQTVNPPQGFIANANNDPVGTTLDNNPFNQLRPGGQGIFYLNPRYDIGNRQGRIDRLIRAELANGGELSVEEMQKIQANVQLLDAELLSPYIRQAFAAANSPNAPAALRAFANDAAVRQAVGRISDWDYNASTGIIEGYDSRDIWGFRLPPTRREINNSVATTIYSVWRGQILKNTVDTTLGRVGLSNALPDDDSAMLAIKNLLDNFAANRGRGASGLNFFDVPNLSLTPEAERDIIILQSLKDSLNLLASPAFAPAFGGSTNQNDYRWGKLHRITFAHPLGQAALPFNIPPGAGFRDLAPNLPGISTDGGFDAVDASGHNARADSVNEFMFSAGPARRFVGEARPNGIRGLQVIPGGASGTPGNLLFGNTLGIWLTNEYHPASLR
jgi:penicillin G amidase